MHTKTEQKLYFHFFGFTFKIYLSIRSFTAKYFEQNTQNYIHTLATEIQKNANTNHAQNIHKTEKNHTEIVQSDTIIPHRTIKCYWFENENSNSYPANQIYFSVWNVCKQYIMRLFRVVWPGPASHPLLPLRHTRAPSYKCETNNTTAHTHKHTYAGRQAGIKRYTHRHNATLSRRHSAHTYTRVRLAY